MSLETKTDDERTTKPSVGPGLRPTFGLRIVDAYLLGEIIPQILLYLLIVAAMFILFTATVVMKYITGGVPVWIVMEILGLNLPPYIVIAFPMSILLGTILAFTKLSTDSEAVALLAAGVSFKRMLYPVFVVGFGMALIGLIINNTVVPYANRRLVDIKEHVLKENVTSVQPFALPPVRVTEGNEQKLQAIFWVEGGFDADTQSMKRVYIYEIDPDTGMPAASLYARDARWNGGQNWILRDVDITRAGTQSHVDTLETSEITLKPDTIAFLDRDPDTLNFRQLRAQIRALERTGAETGDAIRDAKVSLWNKIFLPVASFVFAIVGAALGFQPQRAASRSMAIGQGVLIIFGYYALYKYMETLGTSGQIDAFAAALFPVIVTTIAAAILVQRAKT